MKDMYIHQAHMKDFRKKEGIIILLTDCMSMRELIHTIEVLKKIKNGESICNRWGICSNFKNMFGETWGSTDAYQKGEKCFRILEHLMRKWKHFSGDHAYPVPSTLRDKSAAEMYTSYNRSKIWSKTDNYGRMRYNLLNWLIACCYLAYQERDKYEKKS